MASLNPNLRSFWQDDNGRLLRARIRGLHGGRASSKSWEFAGRAAQIGQKYKTRFLCVRRFQNKIKESVYTLLKNQIDNFGFTGYNVLSNEINHPNGTEFSFYGIERNIEEIKGYEGCDVLWIEEAHNLTETQWDLLEPTIRKEGSEIWLSWNGRFISDFIWRKFIVDPPDDSIIRWVNYDENPFLSKTMMKTIQELKKKDYAKYRHIYRGEPLTDDDKVIIKRSWLSAAIDFHKIAENDGLVLSGKKAVGYDVADSGADKNATVEVDGSIVIGCEEWQGGENELRKSSKRVKLTAQKLLSWVIYDSIGVGAGTGSNLQDMDYYDFSGFNAGGKVIKPKRKYEGVVQKEFFSNLKTQAWWLAADRLRNTHDYVVNGNKNYKAEDLISIRSNIPHLQGLLTELCTPFRDFDKAGRVKVESKEDLLARGVKSPNRADAFIMALSISLVSTNRMQPLTVSGF